jgi:hypothetical protein
MATAVPINVDLLMLITAFPLTSFLLDAVRRVAAHEEPLKVQYRTNKTKMLCLLRTTSTTAYKLILFNCLAIGVGQAADKWYFIGYIRTA